MKSIQEGLYLRSLSALKQFKRRRRKKKKKKEKEIDPYPNVFGKGAALAVVPFSFLLTARIGKTRKPFCN
jgi:hypothetical protein